MNVKELKRLVYDMLVVIETHDLGDIDPNAKDVMNQANRLVSVEDASIYQVEDHKGMIEAIRNDNFHALGV